MVHIWLVDNSGKGLVGLRGQKKISFDHRWSLVRAKYDHANIGIYYQKF